MLGRAGEFPNPNKTKGIVPCKQRDMKASILVSYELNVIPEGVTPYPEHMNSTQNKIWTQSRGSQSASRRCVFLGALRTFL
jgi:hypothetical protein